ncbi:MAG: hypothetical protein AAF569_06490 [Pseudomonadota bacterium]
MIDVLGAKRLMGLLIMAGLVVALAAAHYMILLPRQEKVERELRTLENSISSRQGEIDQLRKDFAELDRVKFRYNELLRFGFVSDQDRIIARARINELKEASGVIATQYQIKPIQEEDNRKITEAGYKLLSSEIDFKIEAFDDVDIYRFIYLLNHGFPGHIDIESVDLKRIRDVSVPLLQSIGTGSQTPLVEARVVARWFTISEDTEAQ